MPNIIFSIFLYFGAGLAKSRLLLVLAGPVAFTGFNQLLMADWLLILFDQIVETYIKNWPFMQLIVAQNEDIIEQRIRNLIHNVGLFNEAKHLQQQLSPIAEALDTFQSDSNKVVWVYNP